MQAQLLDGTLCSTQFIELMLQEACNECRQLTREQLVMIVMGQFGSAAVSYTLILSKPNE